MPSPKASDSVTRGKNPSPSTDSAAKRERSSLIIFRCIRKTCRFFRCHKKKQPQPSSSPPDIYRKYNMEGAVLSAVPAAAVVGAASRARKIHDFVRQNRIFRLFILFTISILYAPKASGINKLSGHHVICLYLYSLLKKYILSKIHISSSPFEQKLPQPKGPRQSIASSYMMVIMVMIFFSIFFFLLSQSLLAFTQCGREAAP